jgi:HAD superfamily hydrolase (TIGR01509 family)
MINTALFDMDGLLLDTEPLWGKSMLRIAEKHGIPITWDKFKETTGLRIYEVTEYWSVKYPWEGRTHLEVAEEILDDIIEASKIAGRVLPGVIQTLELLKTNGFKIGLASSSPERMITALVEHFQIKEYFDEITSADAVALGKPHPAVFLHCAQALGSRPLECVVLEDSVNGMIAGKAARMKVIAVPDELHFNDPRFALADAKLRSMEDFDLEVLDRL